MSLCPKQHPKYHPHNWGKCVWQAGHEDDCVFFVIDGLNEFYVRGIGVPDVVVRCPGPTTATITADAVVKKFGEESAEAAAALRAEEKADAEAEEEAREFFKERR